MKEAILVKEGEIFLKGLNKKKFESTLIKNIKSAIKDLGEFTILKEQSTITIIPSKDIDLDFVLDKISKVFGISVFSKALIVEKDFEIIKNSCIKYLEKNLKNSKNFKVISKRSDKNFPLSSQSICCEIGEFILSNFKHLSVNLHNPEISIYIEIRDSFSYIYSKPFKGAGGIPVNNKEKALLLLSGGIDSPVAAWMISKRGISLSAVHFISPPYTGARALKKVEDLILILKEWNLKIPLYIVNTTKLQEEIKKNCPQNLLTIVLRRAMIKIAQKIAIEEKEKGNVEIKALVTGESLSQVASQTLSAIACTNSVSSIPILRPLIGMDKEEIVTLAKKIGSFNTSILPYEDCCSVFSPKHPKTNPKLFEIENAEKNLNLEEIIDFCLENKKLKIL